ncbi:MAG: nucleoside-diphosphate-sugar pyrophosphorylase [Alphaproteobacteria bacterium]|nr:nucleoside-diphosphate-sugar pyrophosphorylase [Alphaproteobacteria bacterium]
MKIIVQAGGLGSRMFGLTRNKPKALISIDGAPVLFHLFNKYPDSEFIIICDYKKDILARYLELFAKNIRYILVESHEKGNIAGIKEAVSFIPEDESFMVIWSDIILPPEFEIKRIRKGCQVGLADISSRWKLTNGKLNNVPTNKNGIIGLWVFDNKNWFSDCPSSGSFTKWLQQKNIPLHPIAVKNCVDVGTFDTYQAFISKNAIRSRPYNRIEIKGNTVCKTGINAEANALIQNESHWYKWLNRFKFQHIPRILKYNPLIMEKLEATNLFKLKLSLRNKKIILNRIISILKEMHRYDKKPASAVDIYTEYYVKTIRRLQNIAYVVPLSNNKHININGIKCVNVLRNPDLLQQIIKKNLLNISTYGIIHGDPQLTNTMVDGKHNIFYIDPRGYFGKSKVYGDERYDWAKLYFSIAGNFDQFNIKNFDLDITNKVKFHIASNGWESLTPHLIKKIAPYTEKEISLIQIIIWLSMAAVAWEDFDSICVAFYNGNYLLTKWIQKYEPELNSL